MKLQRKEVKKPSNREETSSRCGVRLGVTAAAWQSKTASKLFRSDGEDLLGLDFDFDAEGRADVAALDDGAAHPDVAGKIGSLERIVEGTAARVADKRMIGAREAVFFAEPVHVGDILELAGAVRSFAREGPVAGGKCRRAGGQTDDRCGNILTSQTIADKEIGRRPGLRKIGDISDYGIGFGGMGQQGRRIRRRRRDLQLGSLLGVSGFGRFGSR